MGQYLNGKINEGVYAPINVGLYTYVRLSPVTYVDPDGRNWFKINGGWEWHKGNTYTVTNGTQTTTYTSSYTHLIRFNKTGTNENGAAVGDLTLYEQDRVVASSRGFSGGADGSPPAANGDYLIRLDIKKNPAVDSINDYKETGSGNYKLDTNYGMQTINGEIVWIGADGREYTMNPGPQWEWGSMRARLNEQRGETRSAAQGLFLHGKNCPGDYTNGCIAERSEAVLGELLKLREQGEVAQVPVTVTGPD